MQNRWLEKLGFSKKKIEITAPIEGEALPLSEVNDPTFRDKILGDGIAIRPKTGRVVAPVDGKIVILFQTKHAISILSEQGVELLIHIGLDTVKLKGEFFKSYVQTNQEVKKGDLLLEFDMKQIEDAAYDLISPIVICNTSTYSAITTKTRCPVKELDKIITLQK